MKRRILFAVAAVGIAASGCSLFSGRGDNNTVSAVYKYKPLYPPTTDAVGKEILQEGIASTEYLFRTLADKENIARRPAGDAIDTTTYQDYEGKLDVKLEKAALDVGASYANAKTIKGTSLWLFTMKGLGEAIIPNRKWIYQCIGANSSVVETSSKTTAGVAFDVSKFAAAYGVDVAKVTFGALPDRPDTLKVTISDPDICLGYVQAEFRDNNVNFFGQDLGTKFVNFSVGSDAERNLRNVRELVAGQGTNPRTPQFWGREPALKPQFWLQATKSKADPGKIDLHVCWSDVGDDKDDCKLLEPRGDGVSWNKRYFVRNYSYEQNHWKSISVVINAMQKEDKIVFNTASMYYPQYILKLD